MSRWVLIVLAALFVTVVYLLARVGTQHTELERLHELRDAVCTRHAPADVQQACDELREQER